MNQEVLMRIFLIVMTTFIFVAIIVPFIKKIAFHVEAVDIPDKRKVHKIPMPRPVDEYFKAWSGPKRPEFKKNLDMSKFTGNQKWQMYCLEKFLNMYEATDK